MIGPETKYWLVIGLETKYWLVIGPDTKYWNVIGCRSVRDQNWMSAGRRVVTELHSRLSGGLLRPRAPDWQRVCHWGQQRHLQGWGQVPVLRRVRLPLRKHPGDNHLPWQRRVEPPAQLPRWERENLAKIKKIVTVLAIFAWLWRMLLELRIVEDIIFHSTKSRLWTLNCAFFYQSINSLCIVPMTLCVGSQIFKHHIKHY